MQGNFLVHAFADHFILANTSISACRPHIGFMQGNSCFADTSASIYLDCSLIKNIKLTHADQADFCMFHIHPEPWNQVGAGIP